MTKSNRIELNSNRIESYSNRIELYSNCNNNVHTTYELHTY